MTDDSVKRAISITTFAISVTFSAVLFSFSLYEVSKQPDSAMWLSIVVGLVNLYLPSPIGIMTSAMSQPANIQQTVAVKPK